MWNLPEPGEGTGVKKPVEKPAGCYEQTGNWGKFMLFMRTSLSIEYEPCWWSMNEVHHTPWDAEFHCLQATAKSTRLSAMLLGMQLGLEVACHLELACGPCVHGPGGLRCRRCTRWRLVRAGERTQQQAPASHGGSGTCRSERGPNHMPLQNGVFPRDGLYVWTVLPNLSDHCYRDVFKDQTEEFFCKAAFVHMIEYPAFCFSFSQ